MDITEKQMNKQNFCGAFVHFCDNNQLSHCLGIRKLHGDTRSKYLKIFSKCPCFICRFKTQSVLFILLVAEIEDSLFHEDYLPFDLRMYMCDMIWNMQLGELVENIYGNKRHDKFISLYAEIPRITYDPLFIAKIFPCTFHRTDLLNQKNINLLPSESGIHSFNFDVIFKGLHSDNSSSDECDNSDICRCIICAEKYNEQQRNEFDYPVKNVIINSSGKFGLAMVIMWVCHIHDGCNSDKNTDFYKNIVLDRFNSRYIQNKYNIGKQINIENFTYNIALAGDLIKNIPIEKNMKYELVHDILLDDFLELADFNQIVCDIFGIIGE